MRVVVIGAGAIGANIAYRLAAEGADVTLLDGCRPAAGTSSASLAWLSSFPQMSWTEDPGRARLRRAVHASFDALEAEIGGGWLHWSGTLTWELPDRSAGLADAYSACRERGVALERLDGRAARAMAPQVSFADDEQVIYEAKSGWVDAPHMIATLLDRFRDRGGTVATGVAVVELPVGGARVRGARLSDGRLLEADAVVNAAGSWGTHVAAMAGVALPLELVPGLMIYTTGAPGALPRQVLSAPTWIARTEPGGGLALHWRGNPLTSVHGANGDAPEAIVAEVAATVPALRDCTIAATRVGIRAIPPGGPIVGALPWLGNLYFALSHGGVGWGPTWAKLAAQELLGGEVAPELAGMRPGRFFLHPASLGRFADDAEHVPHS